MSHSRRGATEGDNVLQRISSDRDWRASQRPRRIFHASDRDARTHEEPRGAALRSDRMTTIDLAALLAPVSAESPSGPSMEYGELYLSLERLVCGVAQQEDANGKVIREAEEPDWNEVRRVALELCAQAKDLRVAIYLTRAELALSGLPGFADALALVAGYVEQFWSSVHPQLDPADGDDPSIRVNAIASLRDHATVLRSLRLAPLAHSRQFGRISYRDHAIAAGLMPLPSVNRGDDKPADSSRIEAAFADTPIDILAKTRQAAEASLRNVQAVNAALEQAVGSGKGPDLAALLELLGEIKTLVDRQFARREIPGSDAPMSDATAHAADAAQAGRANIASAAIRSRDDVLLLFDKICRYYTDNEPSSPVPLILNRTRKLVAMNFLDILKDLTPTGVAEFGLIAGIKQEGE
jgi:type VI secretion system protein ImpA